MRRGMPEVLEYNRPLLPGTVRITHRQGSVTIQVAPDTARRIVYTALGPLLILAIFAVYALMGVLTRGRIFPLLVLVGLFVAGGVYLARVLRRGREPIVFRANPTQLEIQNPLDQPPHRAVFVPQIASLQLRRAALPAEFSLYHLEIVTRRADHESAANARPAPISLLASPSFETLDKIGRTLITAMELPEPVPGPAGWSSDQNLPPSATPSSEPTAPHLRSSPDPAC
jgi:hypothetical protein